MKKFLIWLAGIFLGLYLIISIRHQYVIKRRTHYLTTYSICNNLKVEKYKVSSWSDLYSVYLTDSANFRVFIDTYYYYETIDYKCNGDSIFVNKFNTDEAGPKLISSKVYFLHSLKEKSNYK